MNIHETAIIYPQVVYGPSIIVEAFAILGIQDRFHPEGKLVIGERAFIGSRCTLYAGVWVGDDFDISDQSTVFYDNKFGNACRIGPKAIIKNGCRLGDRVRVNAGVFMERVNIGSNVFIGPGTTFTDDKHPPCPRNGECTPHSDVGSFVSIGANVVIAPGIKIGHHCQVYAGSVVTRDVEPYSVVAGNPARKVGDFQALVCSAGLYEKPFEWWK
jgi:UDP-2-acetamido-3-amino-2,3-dideoxy-glucuronate N-acetyltransferase